MPILANPRSWSINSPRLRADARRNRERILLAARDVFIEQGPDAPLDKIAARADVGIATLYRRFPDRQALARAVVLEALGRVADEARLALTEEPDAFRALARYMCRALALRVSAVIPALLGRVSLEDEEMIDRARSDGTLRPDVTFADVALLLVRLSRPLPGPIPRSIDEALAHRHLDLLLDGLRAASDRPAGSLPAPAMTRDDLHALSPDRKKP